jgi:(p)ppGpp synthase/HD superfamily hydrolase
MIFKAIEFAAKAHAGQYRKGTKIPYICHPMNVCQILASLKCSPEVMAAGILHDVLEDTRITGNGIILHWLRLLL